MSTPLQCLQCQSTIFYVGHCYRCKSQQKMQYWMEQSDQDIALQLEHLLPLLNSPNSEEKKQAVQTAVEIWCYRGQARPDVSEKIWVLAEQKEYKDTHDYLFLCTAPYSVAKQALHRLSTETLTRRQIVDLLSILAQINWELKYPNITQFFQQSVAQPYTWQEDIPLLLLTHSSGWSFSQSAAKLLTHPPYSLVATATQESKTYSHQLGVRQKETCSFCKVPLFDLLVLDSGEPALHFLGWSGKLIARACPYCIEHSVPFFIRHLSMDTVELLPYQGESLNGNRLQKYIEDISVGSQTLSLQKMPANFSYIQGHLTVIGGVPDWIQRSEYLECPDCQKTMHHIAEIPLDHIWKDRSGKIYCQGCPDCRMVGLFHQRR